MRRFLLFLWQLPQNVAGIAFWFFCTLRGWFKSSAFTGNIRVVKVALPIGVSLGCFVFVRQDCPQTTIDHELGHCRQSEMLGPLYLPVIGIPSLSGNLYDRAKKKGSRWYYSQPWEAWADRLGGVERGYR